ncbi:MAG: MATE family multidrug resistance protein [Paracoccaceae bacterium]|jgi:MATE family multidrug resistance protein
MSASSPSSAPLTHRRVLRIAGPIMLSNVSVPLLGAVDTGVIGQLGTAEPIGAVAIGATILGFIYWLFGFLRMGTSGLAAQARGAGDMAEVRALLTRGLMIAAAAGLGFILLQPILFPLALMLSPASAEVEAMTSTYLGIRIWGAPAAIAVYALTGWLIAMERTRGVLVLQLGMNGLNIGLDLWFVLGLDFGIAGVAVATVIAEFAGAGIGLWLCRDAFAGGAWRDWPRVMDPARLRNMAAVNGDILIRSALLQVAFASFVFRSAREGDVTLAANQVLFRFFEITAYALDGFAFAAEALVGVAFGAKRPGAIAQAARLTSLWGLAFVGVLSAVFLVFGGMLTDVMTTSEEVRARARDFLPWIALAPLLGLPCFMLDGIFIGATRTGAMRTAMIESVVIYAAAMVALGWAFGAHGLWAALMVFFVARGLTLGRRYPALLRAAGG